MSAHADPPEAFPDGLPGTSPATRRQFLRRVGAGSLAVAVGGMASEFLAATGAQGATAAAGKTLADLTLSFSNAAPTFDIATSFVGNISTMMLITQEPLVTYDNRLRLIPHLAAGWTQPRPSEYVFKLRPGVKFWDGTPLTADDVVYSFSRLLDPKFGSPLAGIFSNMKSVAVAGANAVSFQLATPDETFPYNLSLAGIVKRSVAEPLGRRYATPGSKIVGTGPFKITSYDSPQAVTLERFDGYWGTKPAIEKVSISVIPDETTRQLAMRSGSTIMCYDVSVDQIPAWLQVPHVAVPVAPGLETAYLSFDLSQKPWNDIHVRRAFAYAWNPQLVKAVMGTASTPATSIIPPGMWGNVLSASQVTALYARIAKYPFSLAKAAAELKASSSPKGFSASIAIPNTDPQLEKAALSLSQNLKSIGVKLNVTVEPQGAWLAYQNKHKNLGLQVQDHGPDFADPIDYFQSFYYSKQAVPNGQNTANYRSAAFDRLLAQQRGERNKQVRGRQLSQMLLLATNSLAYLPFWWTGFAISYRADKMRYTNLTSLCYLQTWPDHITAV